MPGLIESNVCLLPMITPKTYYLLSLYKHYQNNVLWVAGGISDQPNYYKQVMEML